MDALPSLLGVLVVVLANGFFVASEFALVTVRRSRLEQRIAEGSTAARLVRDAQEHLDTYIAAVQLGVTMASLALGWLGEPAVAVLLEPVLAAVPFPSPTVRDFATHTVSAVLAFAVITTFHIVFGELVPKSVALQRTEAVAYFVVRPMGLFRWVFGIPINLLKGLGNLVLRLIGLQPVGGEELVHSVDELRVLVAGSSEAGVLDETEAEIVGRVLGFHELSVREVMIPRTELQAIPVTASLAEVMHLAATSGHSRFPVYEGDLDHVVGVLYLKDLFPVLEHGIPARFDLRRVVRQVPVVPDSLPVDTLLVQLQRERRRLAVVVDEFGGIAGLVTLQDVFERIVGQFGDEYEAVQPAVVPLPDGSLLIDGLARIEDVAKQVGLAVNPEDTQEVETMGGLMMLRLGRLPTVGDEVHVDGTVLRVEQMDGRRVARLRLLPSRPQVAAD
ncbi:MAG TPA: hemolysin family protein [Chloroflexota bacterium]|nr:hemolysin family protein [Chloroflexota bacterium]